MSKLPISKPPIDLCPQFRVLAMASLKRPMQSFEEILRFLRTSVMFGRGLSTVPFSPGTPQGNPLTCVVLWDVAAILYAKRSVPIVLMGPLLLNPRKVGLDYNPTAKPPLVLPSRVAEPRTLFAGGSGRDAAPAHKHFLG